MIEAAAGAWRRYRSRQRRQSKEAVPRVSSWSMSRTHELFLSVSALHQNG